MADDGYRLGVVGATGVAGREVLEQLGSCGLAVQQVRFFGTPRTAGLTVDEVTASSRRDFWLDAGQALEYGLINKVVKNRKDLPSNTSPEKG